jgi:hypothetical protein
VRELAAVLPADPLRVAAARGDLAVERHRGLEQHPRTTDPRVLAERLVEQPGAARDLPVGEHDLHALVAQDAQAAARSLLGGVVGGQHHAPDPRLQDRVGAGRRLALVAARLERHVEGRAAEVLQPAGLDRVDLGVRAAVLLVPALAEDLAVAGDHRAHHRVRPDRARALARELDRSLEMSSVGIGAGTHRPQDIPGAARLLVGRYPHLPPCKR